MTANALIQRLRENAQTTPTLIALENEHGALTYETLWRTVESLSRTLHELGVRRLALEADNGPAWICADLACLHVGVTLIPIPLFFTASQREHLLNEAAIEAVITQAAEPPTAEATLLDAELGLYAIATGASARTDEAIEDIIKVTYTSGSTAQPKGARLNAAALETVMLSLAQAVEINEPIGHLCTLPLATLLENIAGVYVALYKGGRVIAPALGSLGLNGSSGLDLKQWAQTLQRWNPQTLILTPELLKAMLFLIAGGQLRLNRLQCVAVGGAKVSPVMLAQAAQLGVPVYEGYGLSECASVVSLNRPSASRPGSVGKPLSHISLSFADDGEIIVEGPVYSGYLGEPQKSAEPVHTGDIGRLDEDGYLYLEGRKKNLIVTAFGRNLSPEWVESELLSAPCIAQAALFGDGEPFNVAVVTPAKPDIGHDLLMQAVEQINQRLPDYAQVRNIIISDAPFSAQNGQLTANGRVRRCAIAARHKDRLNDLFQSSQPFTRSMP
ncbi:Long-chain acyl-CoA synthetases (AMP-forming) [Hahella chejuensis KCTC 2396]|uniref:Long-chain acyl-CoA synthetases (AMP-forming) n=1 Tax=Hahella chejuensis (strain KCTC 2396) TaxID=349521 RepID=Q2S7X6_HAHCH|nr:AMP-binding protein [Hahella chejuensis]ABC33248.1 Long-chain acyl-CoA synthetases (AMP-forming) [Hahella chejuensis KCTC 2396]